MFIGYIKTTGTNHTTGYIQPFYIRNWKYNELDCKSSITTNRLIKFE